MKERKKQYYYKVVRVIEEGEKKKFFSASYSYWKQFGLELQYQIENITKANVGLISIFDNIDRALISLRVNLEYSLLEKYDILKVKANKVKKIKYQYFGEVKNINIIEKFWKDRRKTKQENRLDFSEILVAESIVPIEVIKVNI